MCQHKIVQMKTTGLIFLLFAAATVSAQTNQSWTPCRHPIRVFGDHKTVDLTPLFQWWKQQPLAVKTTTNLEAAADVSTDADRPLSAWHRIAGAKAGELGQSWVVNALIYTSPTSRTNARIILNNPPIAEERLFNSLKTQLAETTRQITNAQRAYQKELKAAQKAEAEARSYRRSGSKHATESSNNFLRLAGQKREAATNAQNQQKQLEAQRPLIQNQLKAIPAVNGQYQIDCFALEVGRSKQGVLIYDLGVVPANSP